MTVRKLDEGQQPPVKSQPTNKSNELKMNDLPLYVSALVSSCDSLFTPQQVTARTGICTAFQHGVRYALLFSQCQAGKTGAFNNVIRNMLTDGTVQRAYIVCGSAETILRTQAHVDAMHYNGDFVADGVIRVIFHQDFDKTTMDITNALIIIDESHLVQTTGQKLHAFMTRHQLTMDGNPATLDANNTYILSVDATPYSENASIAHKETPFRKHIEKLEPGPGYRGLAYFNNHGLIQPTFNIVSNPTRFEALVKLHPRKWILMRVNNSSKKSNTEGILKRLGFRIMYYTSEKTEIAITRSEQVALGLLYCLEDQPTETTIVILRGRLRAGKVVPKTHIGFGWDDAKSSNTDTTNQGLLGRMCGYHTFDIPMFVPIAFLRQNPGKVITMSELGRSIAIYEFNMLISPRKGMNLKSGIVVNAPADKTYCVPLRIAWNGNQLADLAGDELGLKNEGRELLRRNLGVLFDSPCYTPEQKVEIMGYIASDDPRVHHGRFMSAVSTTNTISFYRRIWKAYATNTQPSEHVAEYPPITYIFAHPGFRGLTHPGTSSRHVYVLFYTNATGFLNTVHDTSRIPRTTGLSIFSHDTTRMAEPIVLGGVSGMSHANIQDPVKFEAGLKEYINHWRTAVALTVAREWVPCTTSSRINKDRYHYVNSNDNDIERICRRLEEHFGFSNKQLCVMYARSGGVEFNVKSISW